MQQTLGTISWQQGNLYPSFILLSVSNSTIPSASDPGEALLTYLCFLPMQTHIYIWYLLNTDIYIYVILSQLLKRLFEKFYIAANDRYIALLVLTLLAVLLWPTSSTSFFHQCWNLVGYSRQLITSALFSGETKAKDEDANYEYEMMWDAEGSMHLVKKPLNTSVVNLGERSSGERYSCYYSEYGKCSWQFNPVAV